MTDEEVPRRRRTKKGATQIADLDVQEVSAVDVPANGREFALMKSRVAEVVPVVSEPTSASLAPVFLAGSPASARAVDAERKSSLSAEQQALLAKFNRQ